MADSNEPVALHFDEVLRDESQCLVVQFDSGVELVFRSENGCSSDMANALASMEDKNGWSVSLIRKDSQVG